MILIDADAILQEIEECANAVEIQIHLGKCNKDVAKGMLSGLALVREDILRKETAYNVDKVVAELEEYRQSEKCLSERTNAGCYKSRTIGRMEGFECAIDIVKRGGVE